MTRRAPDVLRRAHGLLAWSLGAAVAAVELGAQEVDPAVHEHLIEPRIVGRADERVLEVRAVGDPDEIGSAAFGLLFQLYFSGGATTGFTPPAARARWQEGLDEIPRGEWIGRYALPIPAAVESLPEHTPPNGVTASITTWEYGTIAEILHIGRYDAEQPTIKRLKAFVEAEGYETFGGHEEEYIVGPTMAGPGDPDEYRTILRYRIRKADPARGGGPSGQRGLSGRDG
ncbi:MAG: GyrI-like domain-containing protein [Gemmatimonadetes bacterium]|nr:GyrI-like domain-containing protein [Candidatus Palauibacter rhopaloidicola]